MNDLKGIIEDCNKSDLVSDKVIKKVIEIIGQEKWQDLNDENNDVCTTMGELIITLNGIAELEKEAEENGKLLQRIVQLEKDVIENESNCSMCDFPKLKQDLEKENAELKERLKEHESIGNAQFWKNVWSWKIKADQLIKARELLNEWVELFKPQFDVFPPTPIQVKTEQFLKESEVEK